MIKAGKKTRDWDKARKELKREFEEMGITTCEIRLQGCLNNYNLSFAHTKKRRYVTDLKRVVLSCINCHQKIEYASKQWSGLSMEEYLEDVIKGRWSV